MPQLKPNAGRQRNRYRCDKLKLLRHKFPFGCAYHFERFLSAESLDLMSIKDLGEFKFCAIERFRGILHRTVKAAIGNNSPIPDSAAVQVIEAWNVGV
jgi:hypothetical protein